MGSDRPENGRLEALRALEVFGSAPEDEFDGLVQAAAAVCETPMSSLTLIEAERVWPKAQIGLGLRAEVPRHLSFCTHAIETDDLMVINDATKSDAFKHNPFVTGEPGIRFYAGAPIHVQGGHRVGVVCVLDRRPRRLSARQREGLRCLAVAAARALECRNALQTHHQLSTKLAKALKGLEASSDNLRSHYEATPAMLHSVDAHGRLLMVSDAWLSTLGYDREAVVGQRATAFFTAASQKRMRDGSLADLSDAGCRPEVIYQMVAQDGRVIDVNMSARLERDENGHPFRSLTVVQDVTSRLAAERALQTSEARYHQLASATSDVVTQLDLDLVRRYASPACRTVLGYEPEEFIGISPRTTLHPDDAPHVLATMKALIAGSVPGDRATVTNRMRHKQGHWVWLEAGIVLVRDPERGTPQHLVCALRDVTERLVAERLKHARLAAERDAEQKSEFLSNMSHELRTPLTGILGIHDILQRDPTLGLRQRAYVAQAHQAGQALMGIINDVLDFSKIEAGQMTVESTPVDLRALVESACDCVRGQAQRKSLQIEAYLPDDSIIYGDPVRLRQILLNLLSNAVKFTMEGHVWIEAQHDAASARLRLSVSDTGMGMSDDQLATIFERFRQADGSITRQYGGTGLGLAICKRLVELMGGSIAVRSLVGAGSTFTVELPAEVAPAVPANLQMQQTIMPPRNVLLVEDNLLNQEIVGAMLRDEGHAVSYAVNGQEAVDAVLRSAAFDVILMDVQMPVLDGLSTTRAIRELERAGSLPHVPIIGLTANASSRDLQRCRDAGMDGRITKPVDWAELFTLMGRLTSGVPASDDNAAAMPKPAVIDVDARRKLLRIVGAERFRALDEAFVTELMRDGGDLDRREAADLVAQVHGWISMAGHLGFAELSESAAAAEQALRAGRDIACLADLQVAILRALAVARGDDLARVA